MYRSIILIAVLAIPGLALAAPADAAASTGSSGLAGLITAITALLSAGAALVAALRGIRKAKQANDRALVADARAQVAESWADRLANAHADGVVLVLSYPGCKVSCRGLLEVNGWRIAHYPVTQAELDQGKLLPGPHMIDDVRSADAIVVEGLDETGMSRLAWLREFRDNIRSGAGVALYTGGANLRYDLTLWGECDQGVTTPVTTEAAVRGSLARRAATAQRQGIRPGQLGAARQALVASAR